ncbi:alpha/beta hydrolase [Algoriphagus mannitolivorans]|uniref:alpha/beta hydrolase n=1 Tax=Algoriphagus mannitolivorans TaxID=226504 RepID=UPI0003FD7DC7|nr:dienelactone hydrolase family protein [Algoriphagus mannitolivorans]
MKKSFFFSYEAQYSQSHEPSGLEKEIWIVFHGYGQLAEFFIRKFLPFDSPDRLFIAPEGTNYAYLKDFEGRVGANWMTRHEREVAIANNHRYFDSLMSSILEKFSVPPKVHVLGFSQGAATATRWASQWKMPVETLVLWAGGFALDLKLESAKHKFESTTLVMVFGDQDEFLTEERMKKQEELVKELGKEAILMNFPGGHVLETDILQKVIHLKFDR